MREPGPNKRQLCNLVAIHSAQQKRTSRMILMFNHLQGKKEIQVVHEKSDQALGVVVPESAHGYQLAAFLDAHHVESPEIQPSQP
jgi:hypothetical protein